MMRSLYSGVSGLKNHQTRMDVVGNNISNVNTTGFKSSRVTFADTLSQTLTGASRATENRGGTNPKQIGLGSQISAVDLLFTDGSVQSTGVNTDLCLSGNGLFIVGEGNNVYYTRNGNFSFDEQGNYCTDDGLKVKGWMADDDGNLDTTSETTFINIPAGKPMAAKATTMAQYSKNLNASAPTIVKISGGDYTKAEDKKEYNDASQGSVTATKDFKVDITYEVPGTPPKSVTVENLEAGTYAVGGKYTMPGPPAAEYTITKMKAEYIASSKASKEKPVTITLSDGTVRTEISGKYDINCSLPVATTVTAYDTLGNVHNIPVYFTKTKVDSTTGNEWTMSVNLDGSGKNEVHEEDGSITKIAMDDHILKFNTSGAFIGESSMFTLTLDNGAEGTQEITLDMSSVTQYAGSNTVFGATDGNAAGTLKSISVDSSGIITGTYTNGVNKQEAQVAIAQFNNAAGLTKIGGSLYTKSNNSGEPNVKTAADLGCKITPSALEMSNVDLATELSDMIVTQRGFQSNSKIITVSDEMIETLVNMKR